LATNIHKAGALFTTVTGKTDGLKPAKVTWSSDAGNTTNTGYGYVTAVTDANNLAIYKVSGADFANSYYFTIKSSWYVVPTTGSYLVMGSIRWKTDNMVADKLYYCCIMKDGTFSPAFTSYVQSAVAATGIFSPINVIASLTAGELISLVVYNTSGVDTTVIWGDVPSTSLSIMMLNAT